MPIGQWEPVFAPTGYVAHWCVISHRVGIMAVHGVSQGVVFATSHPSPTHPTLPHRPSHPPPLLSILTAERDGKKYLEIQPSEIEKVSYNKNQWITKYITAQHAGTIQGLGLVFVSEYFKMVFLEIPLGAN